jgi:2-polyprenyl-3-methyl-5-hydroxy-6-metoxy-1,4-benzoquinol methylase
MTVLDIGSGTGLITNALASRYNSEFTGVDFSAGVDYAKQYADTQGLTNVQYIKQDFFEYETKNQYDVVICQSFITHVPNYLDAIEKIKGLVAPNGILLLGAFNRSGKLLKKYCNLNYKNDRLALDQEHCPYEVSFTHQEILNMCKGLKLLQVTPSIDNRLVDLVNLFNSKNGGLTLYVFEKD